MPDGATAARDPVTLTDWHPLLSDRRLVAPVRQIVPAVHWIAADLFAPDIANEAVAKAWAVMAWCSWHRFCVWSVNEGALVSWHHGDLGRRRTVRALANVGIGHWTGHVEIIATLFGPGGWPLPNVTLIAPPE